MFAAWRCNGPDIAAKNAAPTRTSNSIISATVPIARCSIARCYAPIAIAAFMPSNGNAN
jgi:hypothetical protein